MELTLAIIKPNDFQFDKNVYKNNKLQLLNDIQEFIELKTIISDDLMYTIVTSTGLTYELIGSSPICFETSTNTFQACYTAKEDDPEPTNKLCSYLIGESVYGNAVLINSKINVDKTYSVDSVTVNNIVDILHSKFIHKGIYLGSEIIEFDYFDHPIEYYNLTTDEEFDKYKMHEFTFMGLGLCLIHEIDSTQPINKRATRLLGNRKINGDVLLISKSANEFNDLNLDLYSVINDLSFGYLEKRNLTDEENKEDNSTVAMNRYSVLQNRHNLLNKMCHGCGSNFPDGEFMCSGCYRLKYHSQQCQESDWNKHKKECLYSMI
jgi:hypothetical protein